MKIILGWLFLETKDSGRTFDLPLNCVKKILKSLFPENIITKDIYKEYGLDIVWET